MEKRLPPSRIIHKTTILFVIALATLGAVGVTATMMSSATTADAAGPRCFYTPHNDYICPLFGTVCPENAPRCVEVGPRN